MLLDSNTITLPYDSIFQIHIGSTYNQLMFDS